MAKHVIKFTHDDGKPINPQLAWCGAKVWMNTEWSFLDAQHAILSAEKLDHEAIDMCRDCAKSMIEALRGNFDPPLEKS